MGIRPDPALPEGDSSEGALALKLCPQCTQLLPLPSFYRQGLGDGYSHTCKTCAPRPSRRRTAAQRRADALAARRRYGTGLRGPYKSKYNPQGLPL